MAIGSGSMADASASLSNVLVSEMTSSGLARTASASSVGLATTTWTGDTCVFVNTWTCTAGTPASGVAECGVFDSATNGNMLCYGTFAGPISMVSGDTLQVTWSVQAKTG